MSKEKLLEDYGIMTEHIAYVGPLYDFLARKQYCEKKNIHPEELSDEESDLFILHHTR